MFAYWSDGRSIHLCKSAVLLRDRLQTAGCDNLPTALPMRKALRGIEPVGLVGYPGLQHVMRLGDANADTLHHPADFYRPDTFNFNVLDVSADGKTLTVTSYGMNSTVQNGFVEYDPVNNPERALFSFQIRRGPLASKSGRRLS